MKREDAPFFGGRYYAGTPGESFRPSNGEEGDYFEEAFCEWCVRDRAFRITPDAEGGCDILMNVLCFDEGDPEYPKEWVYDANGRPECTAFVLDTRGYDDGEEPDPSTAPVVDPAQLDLFDLLGAA